VLLEEVEGELRWQMVPLQEIQEALVDQVVEAKELVFQQVLEQEQLIQVAVVVVEALSLIILEEQVAQE
tara:strand:- start:103 stop:309 length:207 start_codon:yes stop_codon:yes gene_type:complete